MALAENSGLQPIETLSAVKSQQIKVLSCLCAVVLPVLGIHSDSCNFCHIQENNPCCGIDCNDVGINNMREQNVFETLIGKKQQLLLATQVVKNDLKDR